MSSTPWFKFYPGDYLADTQRLTQGQHGAYLLLIIGYYATGEPPPDDDLVLCRISLSDSLSEWKAIRLAIRSFFDIRDGKWFHPRIEKELKKRAADRKAKQDAAFRTNKALGRHTLSDTVSDTLTGRIPDVRCQMSDSEPKKSKTLFADANGQWSKFWESYPRKTGKAKAMVSWRRVKADDVPALMSALEAQKSTDQWQRGIIPHPATWLNGRRWEDELSNSIDDFRRGVL